MRKILEIPDSTFAFTITIMTDDNGMLNGHIAAISGDDFYKDVIKIEIGKEEKDDNTESH